MNLTCPDCAGSGQDLAHRWPDDSPAACETCDGYGKLRFLWEDCVRDALRAFIVVSWMSAFLLLIIALAAGLGG